MFTGSSPLFTTNDESEYTYKLQVQINIKLIYRTLNQISDVTDRWDEFYSKASGQTVSGSVYDTLLAQYEEKILR